MRLRLLVFGISLGLVVLTAVAYGDALWGGEYEFVNIDDSEYVKDNPHVRAGLTWENLRWSLTSFDMFNWHPLTWISWQLDCQIYGVPPLYGVPRLYGVPPRGFHRTNILLHAGNAVLLFLVLYRTTGRVWPAAVVAAFFAVHPLHVESVAWVAERKDVLSTFFWMLTLLAYARYAERPSLGRYLLVPLCLTLGLMSKPMVVTLPCVLLLFDYWPLRRWPRETARQLVLEKIPLFVIVAGCCVLTLLAQKAKMEPALLIEYSFPLGVRLLNALITYITYLGQMVWPSDLAVLYLHQGAKLSLAHGLAAGLLLAGVSLLALYWRRSRPYFLVGWLWYLGTLVPVIGLLQVGVQARADRYTYIPLVGIFIALTWSAVEWLGKWKFGRLAFAVVTMVLLCACAEATRMQLRYWHNSTSLWDRALQVSGDDPRLHLIVAVGYLGENERALAIRHAGEVIRLQPSQPEGHRLLADSLVSEMRFDEAERSMARAVALLPESADYRKKMARILWLQDKIPAAYEQLAVVARLQPESKEGQHYLGTVMQRQGKLADAVHCFEHAVSLAPDDPLCRVDLAFAFEEQASFGSADAAATQYQMALRIQPGWPAEGDRLARILATHPDARCRDAAEAIRRARQACHVTEYRYSPYLDTLAAAFAEAGRFPQAVATAERAYQLALDSGQKNLADRIAAALRLYKNGQPLRESNENSRHGRGRKASTSESPPGPSSR